jgi:aryl-alcohol dehydrogenase-like predicted oxidoreductase
LVRHRKLGRTGLEVSVLGFGAWGIGGSEWIGADDSESLLALRRAIELGVTFIDTANAYGDGRSERLVGEAVRRGASGVHVATKVPPMNDAYPASAANDVSEVFPARWIIERTEASLRNLGVETIDLQQLHVWTDEWTEQGDWLEAIERLKAEGKIRFFGVSLNVHQPWNGIRLVESGQIDTVQVIYNVFDQSPEDTLFGAVEKANVGVIARVPLDEGALAGIVRPGAVFPPDDFRNAYFAGGRKDVVWRRVQAIASDLGVPVEEIASTALRFCVTHPVVSTAIPGMRSARNVDRNVEAVEAGPLTDAQVETLRRHRWPRNYYSSEELDEGSAAMS